MKPTWRHHAKIVILRRLVLQVDALRLSPQEVRRELLAESKKHKASVSAALLGIPQTPALLPYQTAAVNLQRFRR